MLELTKSAMRFSWAMSVLGVQETLDLLAHPRSEKERKEAASSLDCMTQATQSGLGYLYKGAFEAGDRVQVDLVDSMSKYFALDNLYDPNKAMRTGAELFWDASDAFRFFLPTSDSLVAWREVLNKFDVYQLVRSVQTKLRIPREGSFKLAKLVDDAYMMGAYPSLWAVEGLGHDYADSVREKGEEWAELLKGKQIQALPAKSLLMLNAGIGLSFAQNMFESIQPTTTESELSEALDRFVQLCEDNATPGYTGAAIESLGLVTRTFRSELLTAVDTQLGRMDEEVQGYYWHGVGRAVYFLLVNFLPYRNPLWRAIEIGREHSSHKVARRNTTAGTAWALTLVNMRHPQIMAAFLKEYGDDLAEDQAAFVNGVSSSVIMRFDTSPDDPNIESFRNYTPGGADRRMERLWGTFVKEPIDEALDKYYKPLKETGNLGEVFRYQSLAELVQRVGQKKAGKPTLKSKGKPD